MKVVLNGVVTNLIVNNIDILNFYIIVLGLVNEKFRVTKKVLTIGILCGTALGICASIFDVYIYKLIFHISIFYLVHRFLHKKIHTNLIIYVMGNAFIIAIQFIVMIAFIFISISNENLELILSQVFVYIIVSLLYKKTPMEKIFDVINYNLTVKCLFYTICVMLFGGLIYFDFQKANVTPYYLTFYITLIIISIIGFLETEKTIKYCSDELPMIQHDIKHALIGISTAINSGENIEEIKNTINDYLIDLGIDPQEKDEVKDIYSNVQDMMKQDAKALLDLINSKNSKEIEILTDLSFYESNPLIPESATLEILGILLDNAIEASSIGQKIMVAIYITQNHFMLKVSNSDPNRQVTINNNLEKIFKKGYTTKVDNKPRRGYGLYNLQKIVKKYGGKINVYHDYIEQFNDSYIIFEIELSNCDDRRRR